MRRALMILSVALLTAGSVLLADAVVTLAWKEPVSAIYSELNQGAAEGELEELAEEFATGPAPAGPAALRRAAGRYEERIAEGEGMARISAPVAGIDWVVLEGTAPGTLQTGPGHYPDTGLPGQGGTVAIAGHRTTYGAPFRDIDSFGTGDEIVLELPYGTFTYEVTGTEVVEPTRVEIVDDVGRERLVLTACHPLYSAAERYAVFADLVSSGPAR